ncbi:PAS domain S-box protein [Halorubellus sp. JP-L1]|uniref:histidine kinase N-terminal 7TM domain-containing protein n=1 Tax=Halorubellus sp. JP-L1 TaxID=2715753 RepID=UPI0014098175|nr:histidine kinase N-terminal 7TM domain-containing protein [Halorubellus sp. JP-L1]NHN40263.1 PAS domain S-box protein [Halorubellus sp. JP-L1]
MAWQYTPYVIPTAIAASLSFALFAYIVAIRRRDLDDLLVRAFVALTLSIAVWGVGDVLQLSATTLGLKRVMLVVQFVAAVGATVALLAFALAYTDNDRWVSRWTFGPLVLESLAAFALLLTSPRYHDLYVTAVGTETVDGVVQIERTLGPAATAHVLVSYLVILAAIALLVHASVRSESVFRSQSIAVIVGVALPFLINVVWFLGQGPGNNVDLTVVGFGLAVFPLWYAVSRHGLLTISPIARDTVIENMQDAVVVVDADGRIVDANPAVAALGRSDDDGLVGATATDAFPFLRPALVAGTRPPEEVAVETDDGTQYFDVNVQALRGDDDGSRLVLLRDVTERRRVEERYQRLIENSSDVITVLGANGRIKYDSPAIESLLGYDQDEWVGRRGRDRLHPEDRDRIVAEFQEGVQEPGYETRLEYRIRHADGSYRVFETFASNLLNDAVVDGIVLNSRDVTERNRRERELERTNERLDEFASVVSHDLRNPLTVGNGYLELARRGEPGALDEVAAAHERMEHIIADALALAREAETVEGVTTLDLDSVAADAWHSVATGNATFDANTGATIRADRSRLQRLLENLFRNAVEHGSTSNRTQSGDAVEHGGSAVAVRVDVEYADDTDADDAAADGEPPIAAFAVADDGVGIPEAERESIFESGVSSTEDGTGFGLAIVETIANAHDWTVAVEESDAGGARFVVDLGSESETGGEVSDADGQHVDD